jgi:glutaredoxin
MTDAEKKEAMVVIQKWNPSTSFPTMVIDNNKCIIGFQENKIKETFGK